MADYEFYPIGLSSSDARTAMAAAAAMAKTAGILQGNGSGGVSMASPGTDYGYPVIMGYGPPTMFTAGAIGQFYYNQAAVSAPYIYVCVDYTAQGYQWMVLGDAGTNFTILGFFDSVELMQSGVTNPQPGDAYGVGVTAPYQIYIFDGLTHTWKNNGPLGIGGQSSVTGIPPHGTTGQALIKASDASNDVVWGLPLANIPDGSITGDKLASGTVSRDLTATIVPNAWSGSTAPYLASVVIPDILAGDAPLIDLAVSSDYSTAEAELEAWGQIYRADTAAGAITFYAADKLTVTINVKIKVVRA